MSMATRDKPEEVPDERTQYSIEKFAEWYVTDDNRARIHTAQGWIEAAKVWEVRR